MTTWRRGRAVRRVGVCAIALATLVAILVPHLSNASDAPLGVAPGARLNAGREMAHTLDMIASTGAKFVRWGDPWDSIEPQLGGPRDWTAVDTVVNAILARGMGVIYQVSGRTGKHGVGNTYDLVAQYAAFAADAAAHLGDRALAYEIVNEPDHFKADHDPTPERYVALLKAAYVAIKAARPDAFVLTGGLGGMRADWAKKKTAADFALGCYNAGWKGYFDALAFHPYAQETFEDSLASMRDGPFLMQMTRWIMQYFGDGARQIWVTEIGWTTGGNHHPISEADAASRLRDAVSWMRAQSWIGRIAYFDHRDDPAADPNNSGDFKGVFRADWSPKPILPVFQELAG